MRAVRPCFAAKFVSCCLALASGVHLYWLCGEAGAGERAAEAQRWFAAMAVTKTLLGLQLLSMFVALNLRHLHCHLAVCALNALKAVLDLVEITGGGRVGLVWLWGLLLRFA